MTRAFVFYNRDIILGGSMLLGILYKAYCISGGGRGVVDGYWRHNDGYCEASHPIQLIENLMGFCSFHCSTWCFITF